MAEPQQEQPRTKEYEHTIMFAKATPSEPRSSKLSWGIYKNQYNTTNPRITVFTNMASDTARNGVISAPMNPGVMLSFLRIFEGIIMGDKADRGKVTCKTNSRDDQGNSSAAGEKIVMSEVIYGKDEDGTCWISVVAKDRPRIKFEFGISDYHEIFHGDGTAFTKGEASASAALTAIRGMIKVYTQLFGDIKEPKPNDGGEQYTPRQPQKPTYHPKQDLAIDDDVF